MVTSSAEQGKDGRRPVLLVDAMNLYMRAYYAYPQMSITHGQQIGGCVGFLKTLSRICRETSPGVVIVAWEGGGSSRRRALHADYKKGRRADQPNRHDADRELPETDDNRIYQITALTKLLKHLPVHQVYAPDSEGDDVIAYLAQGRYADRTKVIVSSDKDLFQLVDSKTTVYSLHRKTYVTPEMMFDDFRVSPQNFALAKALCGDPCDNIEGVKGLGFKTLARRFPFLGSDQHTIILSDLMDYCAAHADDAAVYRHVLAQRDIVERNWKLVHLGSMTLTASQASRVDHSIDTFHSSADRMGFIRRLIAEGIVDFPVDDLMFAFVSVEAPPCTRTES